MGDVRVVGLEEGLHGQLPVARQLDGYVLDDVHVGERVGIEYLGQPVEKLDQGCGVFVEIDEDEAGPLFAAHRAQVEVAA
ncbi:hypothetical protein FQZ97_927860 [compost metagenome]